MKTRKLPISPVRILCWFLLKNDLEEANLFAATIKYFIIIKNILYLNLFMWLKTRTQIDCDLGKAERRSCLQMFFKIGVLRNFDFTKKRLQDRCFAVKFAKVLWRPFSTEHHRWLSPSWAFRHNTNQQLLLVFDISMKVFSLR